MNDENMREEDREANYFAMCLLMPEPLVMQELKRMGNFDLSDGRAMNSLARKFAVDPTIMAIRLGQLGMLKWP